MKKFKLSLMAVALVLGVAASSFTTKFQTAYYWFTAGTTTYTNSGLKTVAQEEAALPPLAPGHSYNTTSGTAVVDGYTSSQVTGTNPPVINVGEDPSITIFHN